MNLAEWLARTARVMPGAPALLTGERLDQDYAGFARRAASLAAGLIGQHGVAPGDRVAILAANSSAYLELMYAAWFAGAAVTPINYKLHPKEAAWIVADCAAKVLVTTPETAAAIAPLVDAAVTRILETGGLDLAALYAADPLPEPLSREAGDLAWLFYTSGTTGRPKGAMLSHANLAAMSFSYLADVDEVLSTDAALYAAPMSHGAGLYNFMHVLRGARHLTPASGGFDAAEILELGHTAGGLSMFAAPTMVRRLVEEAERTGASGEGLRTIVYGGGPMYLADIERAVAVLGPRFVQIYGQGETPMTIGRLPRGLVADRSHPRWRERLASVGLAHSCVEVRIVDDDGRALPPGEAGEVAVKGSSVMLGYWQNPDATAHAIRGGWLHTGDVGVLDEDGFLTLKDRSRDVIISGGSNIYPREVEEVLLAHPKVREAAVLGRPDAEWGEVVVAYVVGAATAAELGAHCLEHIARFKRPKDFVTIAELPKNNYGKVLKTALRELDQRGRMNTAPN
ncbi:MAG: AMP-dependent synthetase [Caulobacteraceae bacterium]|nr:AMP-dependent synthetase [Caulobacteraceae bacterium]